MVLQMITEQPVHPVIEEKVTGSTADKKAISNYGIAIAILMFLLSDMMVSCFVENSNNY